MKRSKASQASVAFLGGAFLCLFLGTPLQAQKRSGSSQVSSHSAAQEWQRLEALLSRIHGQSTSVPENLITPKYTSGALMGNGDIGVVVAGDPLISQQSFWFGKSDFWGMHWNARHNAPEVSILSLGRLTISSLGENSTDKTCLPGGSGYSPCTRKHNIEGSKHDSSSSFVDFRQREHIS